MLDSRGSFFTINFIFMGCSLLRIRYIMLFFRQRDIYYFVYLARHVSTLEGHHQVLQVIYLQLLNYTQQFKQSFSCVILSDSVQYSRRQHSQT
jgi:hypothetical protein